MSVEWRFLDLKSSPQTLQEVPSKITSGVYTFVDLQPIMTAKKHKNKRRKRTKKRGKDDDESYFDMMDWPAADMEVMQGEASRDDEIIAAMVADHVPVAKEPTYDVTFDR